MVTVNIIQLCLGGTGNSKGKIQFGWWRGYEYLLRNKKVSDMRTSLMKTYCQIKIYLSLNAREIRSKSFVLSVLFIYLTAFKFKIIYFWMLFSLSHCMNSMAMTPTARCWHIFFYSVVGRKILYFYNLCSSTNTFLIKNV